MNPCNRPRLYSSPARLGFHNIKRPPFANGALSKTLRPSKSVGLNLCISRHRSDDLNAQKHTRVTEVSMQNRSRGINIHGRENNTFGFILHGLRSLFCSIITLWRGYKSPAILKIEGDVEKVVEIVEDVAETAEKVATMTEEICEDITEEFPQEGAINKAAHFVEHLSEEVIKKAHNTEEFIHKVTSTEKTVETSIENAVEAVEGLITAKPAISKSEPNQDDQIIDTSKGKTNSKSKL